MVLCIPTWYHFQSYSSFSNRELVARTSVMTMCQKSAGALNLFQGKWCHQDQVIPWKPTQPILCQTNCTHFALIYIFILSHKQASTVRTTAGASPTASNVCTLCWCKDRHADSLFVRQRDFDPPSPFFLYSSKINQPLQAECVCICLGKREFNIAKCLKFSFEVND